MKNPKNGTSFIQASRRGNQAKSSFKRQQDLQKGRSGIQKTNGPKKGPKPLNNLPTIQEERQSYRKNSVKAETSVKPSDNISGESLKTITSNNQAALLGRKTQPEQF